MVQEGNPVLEMTTVSNNITAVNSSAARLRRKTIDDTHDDRARTMTAADMVIEALADSEADLREANRQLIDLVADLAFDNAVLRELYERELIGRIHGDAIIRRLRERAR